MTPTFTAFHLTNRRTRWPVRFAALCISLAGSFAAGGALAQIPPKPDWSLADMPSQQGRIHLITGGTSGMGFEDAKALAAAGAHVIIAARNQQRGQEAMDRIRQDVPEAKLEFETL